VLLTNPLDVIRTRLQVNGGNSSASTATATTAASSTGSSGGAAAAAAASASATVNTATMWSEAKALWATDGARALLRGIGPRYVYYNVYHNLNHQHHS
jgi:solute carrier family 25, member 38